MGKWRVTLRWSEATHRLVGGPPEIETESEIAWLGVGDILRYRVGPADWIIGGDEANPELSVLYADDRPVSRVYRMTWDGTVWKIWRDAPGFRQRFEGRLGNRGRSIVGHWDKCEDGKTWVRDFDMAFVQERRRKVSARKRTRTSR